MIIFERILHHPPQQLHQQRFLGMEAVLCLIEDQALGTLDDLICYLLVPVGRQAVHEDRVR